MRIDGRKRLASALLAFASCITGSTAGYAQAEPYRGKTITLVVGYTAGGGYDIYARMLARHMNRFIPGAPNINVQNMPGASSLTAVRYLDWGGAKDGTVITMFDPGLITDSIIAPEQVPVRFSDFTWVGAIMRDLRVCYAWSTTGVKSWNDMLMRKEFIFGATAKGATAYKNGALLRNMFGAPVRQVIGYPGSNEQRLAMERGEIDGLCSSWSAVPTEWVQDKTIYPLVKFTPGLGEGLSQSVPYVGDLATTPDQKAIIEVLSASGSLGRPLIVSKQVPVDRVESLRAAFDATMKDEAFLAESTKQMLPLEPTTGAAAQGMIERIYAAPASVAAKAKEMTE